MKKIFLVIAVLLLASQTFAAGRLSPSEIERVKAAKQLIADVDKKSLEVSIRELEKAVDPQMSLEISEAIAKVYAEVAAEKNVTDQATKEWLFGMVSLNMANLQFGGRQSGNNTSLNGLITRRLTQYLPPEIFDNPNFHVSVE